MSKEGNNCEEEINLTPQDRIGNIELCKSGCGCKVKWNEEVGSVQDLKSPKKPFLLEEENNWRRNWFNTTR